MPVVIPPELKPITPFIRRAEELDQDSQNPDAREIAYFCRTHAVERALALRGAGGNKAIDAFLMTLMDDLERAKSALPEGLAERGKVVCETFALTVFSKADEEDRNGSANKETARLFYNATTFFDILEQFGEVDEEMKERNKYSKWKATEIMKALREGRIPAPGGYGENSDSPPSNASINGNGSLPSPPSAPISYPVNPLSNPASPGLPPNAPNHHPSERMPFDAIPKAPPGGDMGAFPTNTGSYLPQDQYYSPPPQNMGGYPVQQPSTQQFPMYSPPSGSGAAAVPYQKPPAGTDLDTRTKDAMELCAFAMTALKHKETALAKDRLQAALRKLG